MSEVVVMSTQCHLSATNSKIMYWKRFLEKRLKTFGDGKNQSRKSQIYLMQFRLVLFSISSCFYLVQSVTAVLHQVACVFYCEDQALQQEEPCQPTKKWLCVQTWFDEGKKYNVGSLRRLWKIMIGGYRTTEVWWKVTINGWKKAVVHVSPSYSIRWR